MPILCPQSLGSGLGPGLGFHFPSSFSEIHTHSSSSFFLYRMAEPDQSTSSASSSSAIHRESSGNASSSSSSSQVREEEEYHDRDQLQHRFPHPELEHQQFGIPYQGNTNLSAFDDASTVIRDDTWSCVIVLLTFWFFGLSLSFSSTLFVI